MHLYDDLELVCPTLSKTHHHTAHAIKRRAVHLSVALSHLARATRIECAATPMSVEVFRMLHTLFMFSLSFRSQSHENTENYKDENNSVAMVLSCVRRNSSVPVLHASESQRFCCDVIQSFLFCARLGLYSLCSCSRSCHSSSFFSVVWQVTMVSAGLVKCLECAGSKEPSRKGLPRHTVLSS